MHFVALVVAAALLSQQAPSQPDVTGTWRMDPGRSGSPGQSVPVTKMTLVIVQTATEVRIESVSGAEPPIVSTYQMGARPNQPGELLGADTKLAYWDGNQLILERGGTISGQTVSMKQTLALDPARNELVLERLVIVQHGYSLRGAKNYATVKDVFTRAGS